MPEAFDSIYRHGFIRVAAAVPRVRIGDPRVNAERTIELAREADARHATLVAFPELGLSGYSIDDLLHQTALLEATEAAIEAVRGASEELGTAIIVGAPVRMEQGIFNAAVVIHRGSILGVAPKSFLPEYREFYEKRQFRAARDAIAGTISLAGRTVPFGNDLIFADPGRFAFAVEICEDVWGADPAEHLRGDGRRHRADQPVGLQHHRRQGRLPPHARRLPLGPHAQRLRLHRRGLRRIDHRPGLGRPVDDLRER